MEEEAKVSGLANDVVNDAGANPTPVQQGQARESIKTLTDISQDLPNLLQAAGAAISLLSTNPASTIDTSGTPAPTKLSLEERQAAFVQHVTEYYTNLNNIQNALLKQVDLLEEARILPAEHQQDDTAGLQGGALGTGKFDVAWLNARSRDVGREKERELVADAKSLLARLQSAPDAQATQAKPDTDAMEE